MTPSIVESFSDTNDATLCRLEPVTNTSNRSHPTSESMIQLVKTADALGEPVEPPAALGRDPHFDHGSHAPAASLDRSAPGASKKDMLLLQLFQMPADLALGQVQHLPICAVLRLPPSSRSLSTVHRKRRCLPKTSANHPNLSAAFFVVPWRFRDILKSTIILIAEDDRIFTSVDPADLEATVVMCSPWSTMAKKPAAASRSTELLMSACSTS